MKLLSLLLPLWLVGCSSKPAPPQRATGNEPLEPFVEVSGQATPTDLAKFLAGRPVDQGAALSQIQQSPDYQAYSRTSLQRWNQRASRRVDAQNVWQADNVVPRIGSPRTVLYPFGGPDLLYVMAMFPNSQRYVMLGLEPTGDLPALEQTDPATVIPSLSRHAKTMETALLHGYFITKDMKSDLTNGPLQGVTPVLLSALGYMNATIHSVQTSGAGGNPAVEIDFTLPGRGRKSLVYVAGDVSNKRFASAYAPWLSSSAAGAVAYFKAASYLMQDASFSGLRGWILANCRAVVQDDSGIPYVAFDQTRWDLHLFGNYNGPIRFFAKYNQPELIAAYQAGGPFNDLTFGSGYQIKASQANLMIATRR
jgi:hypothetical protein